jgi:hypothetical protein
MAEGRESNKWRGAEWGVGSEKWVVASGWWQVGKSSLARRERAGRECWAARQEIPQNGGGRLRQAAPDAQLRAGKIFFWARETANSACFLDVFMSKGT